MFNREPLRELNCSDQHCHLAQLTRSIMKQVAAQQPAFTPEKASVYIPNFSSMSKHGESNEKTPKRKDSIKQTPNIPTGEFKDQAMSP